MMCSVVGAAIIVPGFYLVIWGQVKEEEVVEDHQSSPHLQNQGTKV